VDLVCQNLSSVAFGGPDLKTLYLGGLGIGAVQVLRSPVAGMPMEHGDKNVLAGDN